VRRAAQCMRGDAPDALRQEAAALLDSLRFDD
jgi:hypothetical protein